MRCLESQPASWISCLSLNKHPVNTRNFLWATLLALILGLSVQRMSAHAAGTQTSPRQRTLINAFWKYQQGDFAGAQTPSFDDEGWQSVGLPHSFSTPYFLSNDFYSGYSWYRKHLSLDAAAIAGKRVSLEFDGVFQEAEAFVNGTPVGGHKGGYTGFVVDITTAVRAGDNLIAVRVNNLWNARLAPRAGEHVFSGGIYRNVYLLLTDPIHVDWYGTFVTTPEVSADQAVVRVKTDIVNAASKEKDLVVRQQIFDPDDKLAAEFSTNQKVAAGGTATMEMASPEIKAPKLWHPDHPSMYTVKTTVLDGPRVADEFITPFGIRTIAWTADQGFFLNGEHLYIRGANVHQDLAGWADATTTADIERDVKLMKDIGFNFIRGSHYPHAPAFVDACDRMGIMFWSENDFWSTASGRREGYWNASGYPTEADDQSEFEESTKRQLAEMIRIHRNHPSIIVWSMCNEPFFSANSVMPKVRTFLKDLVDASHALDPTRPAALGGVQRPTNQNRLDKIGDIAGYNGDGATIGAFQNPGIPNLVSEYNNPTSERPGNYAAGWGDLARDRGEPVKPWRAGQALWCGFDHGSIMGANLGRMGIVDYFRIPKRSWFWYRNEYVHVPHPEWPQSGTPAALKLEADKTDQIRTDGTDSAWLLISVLDAEGKPISNSPKAELTIEKGPGEFPTGRSITFENRTDIPIQDGLAAITIRSYYAGETVIRASSPELTPGEITLRFAGSTPFVEGKTPLVAARPYVRFDRRVQPEQPQIFGRNSPTYPTSALLDHPGAAADDGDANTFWQPAANDENPMWTVDMERVVEVSGVYLTFAKPTVARLSIDVSDDQKEWRPLADVTASDKPSAKFQAPAPANTSGRFVRVRFTSTGGGAIQLAEIEIAGVLKAR